MSAPQIVSFKVHPQMDKDEEVIITIKIATQAREESWQLYLTPQKWYINIPCQCTNLHLASGAQVNASSARYYTIVKKIPILYYYT